MTKRAIEFSITHSTLGLLLVAATDVGVCGVCFGDDEASLEAQLQSDFPSAIVRRNDRRIRRFRDVVAKYIDGHLTGLELPLDVHASRFQERVWSELRQIPRGDTALYGEIAERIGAVSGARAVARACAANPLAVVIPCHRVVPAANGTGGYRWGGERKRLLLEREAAEPASRRGRAKPGA